MTQGSKGGRPKHEPTAEQRRTVEAMAAYGIAQADIARVVGIDNKTLCRHYRDEIDLGAIKANAKVAESLYKKATRDDPDTTAMIWWTKVRMGWKETVVNEHSGTNGGPLVIERIERVIIDVAPPAPRLTIDATSDQDTPRLLASSKAG